MSSCESNDRPFVSLKTGKRRRGVVFLPSQYVILLLPALPVSRRHYKNPKHERRVKSAWSVAADCDLLLFIVDAHRQVRHLCKTACVQWRRCSSVHMDLWRASTLAASRAKQCCTHCFKSSALALALGTT